MKCSIIVFAGFLESGKTTSINKFLNKYKDDKIIILQCEEGIEEIQDKSRTIIEVEDFQGINSELFENLIKKYPGYDIWIEYNGTWPLSRLYQIQLPQVTVIENVLYYMDYTTANIYLSNMTTLLLEQINYADKIIFNRHNGKWFAKGDKIFEVIKTLNPNMEVKTQDDDIILHKKKSRIQYLIASLLLFIYLLFMIKLKL